MKIIRRFRIFFAIGIALLLAGMSAPVDARPVGLEYFSPDGEGVEASFVVFGPGSDIYELEGHAGLILRDSVQQVVINYGVFDFDSPNFVYRFVKGETDYLMTEMDWPSCRRVYAFYGRTIEEYPLNLDTKQTALLLALLKENLRPENRTYRYNYVLDNCATRPLDMVERAAGDSIVLPATPDGSTFREVMRRYHRNYPWYQFGIDLALGRGIDRPISAREQAFAPVVLAKQLPHATVNGRPLVGTAVVDYLGPDVTMGPTPWYLTPLAVGCYILALTIFLTIRDLHRKRTTRWFDAALFGIFGVAGLVIAFLVFISVHEATSPNLLLAWLNPVALVVPALIWLKKCKRILFWYFFINFVVVFASACVWPFYGQSGNAAFVPLVAADLLRSATFVYLYLRPARL